MLRLTKKGGLIKNQAVLFTFMEICAIIEEKEKYKEVKMAEFIICLILGIFCVVIGIINFKGNISTLHSYHRKRVSEEDRIPFGRVVGIGTILNGAGLILFGFFNLLATLFTMQIFVTIGAVFLIAGLAVGLGFSFYGMIKYNKGIF